MTAPIPCWRCWEPVLLAPTPPVWVAQHHRCTRELRHVGLLPTSTPRTPTITLGWEMGKSKRLKAVPGGAEHPKTLPAHPWRGGHLLKACLAGSHRTNSPHPAVCNHPAHGHHCVLPWAWWSLSPVGPPTRSDSEPEYRPGSKNNPAPAQSDRGSPGRGDSSGREHPQIAARPLLPPPPAPLLGEHPLWSPQTQPGKDGGDGKCCVPPGRAATSPSSTSRNAAGCWLGLWWGEEPPTPGPMPGTPSAGGAPAPRDH